MDVITKIQEKVHCWVSLMLKTVVLINTIQDLSWLSSFCRGAPGEHLCFKEYSAACCIKEDHNIIAYHSSKGLDS